jgi:hypothetical protein
VAPIKTGSKQEGANPFSRLSLVISHYWQKLTESQAGKGKLWEAEIQF